VKSRAVTAVPTGASACSTGASVAPSANTTAPSGGITVPPPTATAVTSADRSAFGTAVGNGSRTISAAPGTTGVRGPNAGVKRITWPALGTWLSPFSGRR